MKALKVVNKTNFKEVIVEGIRIIRGYPKSKLSTRRSKNSGYKDWGKILETMRVGDVAVVDSRNLWNSANYQARKLGITLELFRFDDDRFAIYRKK